MRKADGGVLEIQTPAVFEPLLKPARYKGAHGGRGSGKSHNFADLMVEECLLQRGTRAVCVREVQKSLKESAKRLIEDKIKDHGLGEQDGFQVFEKFIRTPGDGQIIFEGMNDHNAESIKSLEGYRIAWVEEAHTLSRRSLEMLRPTIREEGSELWFSWNPRRRTDPVDAFLRGPEVPEDAVVVKANWYDNPFFPDVLEKERRLDFQMYPERYDHIWEGDYATVIEGAYYAEHLAKTKRDGRIGQVAADPYMAYRAYCDIGGTGAKADAFAIWIVQFVGRQVLVLDYYEAIGQPLAAHIAWLRDRGYAGCEVILPHDGDTNDRVHDASFKRGFNDAGFTARVIPNQGKGAARQRIEAARRRFPQCWFHAETTEPGREALGAYHEKRDEQRLVGLGPEHDWASHAADAFGLMAIDYQEPRTTAAEDQDNPYRRKKNVGWMGR